MNKKQVLAELIKNLEKYLEKGYVFHPKFMEEFQALLKNATGNEKEIFALLVKQLDFLKELGTNVFIVLSLTNIREAIFNAIPKNLKSAVSVGIGLFIAFIGKKF